MTRATHDPLLELSRDLSDQHQRALRWFSERRGQLVPWPKPLDDGTLLVSKPKGIYKPEWSDHALSIRHSLASPYPDQDPEIHPDGSWTYRYYQETFDLENPEAQATNRGLVLCQQNVVPVGVLIQERPKPGPLYRVLGLALVTDFEQGYFTLEGLSGLVLRDPVASSQHGPQSKADLVAQFFDPAALEDRRERVLTEVRLRQGQRYFRTQLLRLYAYRCAVTGYDAAEALEAAHIVPYRGSVTNHPSNGILLRADVHSLFDLGLVAINPSTRAFWIQPDLKSTKYAPLEGRVIDSPSNPLLSPSEIALEHHWHRATGRRSA